MSETIRYEFHLAVLSLWTGVGLMMVYDLLCFFRMMVPHHIFWINAEDLIYWIYSAMITFGLLYEQNDGNLRSYVIGGVFLGMFLYEKLIGRKLLKGLKNMKQSLKMRLKDYQKNRNR